MRHTVREIWYAYREDDQPDSPHQLHHVSKPVRHPCPGQGACIYRWVYDVAFSPDGSQIVAGDSEGVMMVWDVETGDVVNRILAHNNWLTSLDISPDGHIVTASRDHTLVLWETDFMPEATDMPTSGLSDHVARFFASRP